MLERKVKDYLLDNQESFEKNIEYNTSCKTIKSLERIIEKNLIENEEYNSIKTQIIELELRLENIAKSLNIKEKNEIENIQQKLAKHTHDYVIYKTTDDHDGWSRVNYNETYYQQCCICGDKRTQSKTCRGY